jgi:dTDP-4-amino-4,6-dideoxygalactose transaminase
METNIPFALPYIGEEEEEAVLRVLRSGWLTTGKEALAFEQEFAAFLGSADDPEPLCALAVNSATSGLHLALEACGIKAGDVVLVPSYTFTSTAEVARYLGADVVFVDLAPGTFHMDPNALEYTLERMSRRASPYESHYHHIDQRDEPKGTMPKAVLPVHIGGLSCDMKAIMDIAGKYGLKVIEDAAHAFPAKTKDGRWAGTIGDAGVFSFYATKTITTGEGGMVVSRDQELCKRIMMMRSHGIDRPVWNRYTDRSVSWYYEVLEPGYKYNLPDILAGIGRVQLSRANKLLAMRQHIAAQYDKALAGDERFILPPTAEGNAYHLYPLGINKQFCRLSRDECIEKLKVQGIGVSVHFIPLHIMPYYKNRYRLEAGDLPETMKSFSRVISLPIWPGMTDEQVEKVIAVVQTIDQ